MASCKRSPMLTKQMLTRCAHEREIGDVPPACVELVLIGVPSPNATPKLQEKSPLSPEIGGKGMGVKGLLPGRNLGDGVLAAAALCTVDESRCAAHLHAHPREERDHRGDGGAVELDVDDRVAARLLRL